MFSLLVTASAAGSSNEILTSQAVSEINAFQQSWDGIDWDAILAIFIRKSLYLTLSIVPFRILHHVGKYLINKPFDQYSRKATLNEDRLKTLHSLLNTTFYYTLGFFFIYATLSIIGVPIGLLLADAGIVGTIIGLDAQGFMGDIITGFFVIMKQQMGAGDYIKLTSLVIEGIVVSAGTRTLQLKATDGTVHFVPNRNITTASNFSYASIQVLLDVRIVFEKGYSKIYEIIDRINCTLAKEYQGKLQAEPSIFELVDFGNGNFAVHTVCYALNGEQYALKGGFLSFYVKELIASGFTIPNGPIAVGKQSGQTVQRISLKRA